MNTEEHFDSIFSKCLQIFELKTKDYTPSWRLLRPPSLTDQMLIKVLRLRNISNIGVALVDESINDTLESIVNYSIMGLIQLSLPTTNVVDISYDEAVEYFKQQVAKIVTVMVDKNHDYGEAWRIMRFSSIVDIMLVKLHRIKSIEDNNGDTIISEGIESNYVDIANYAVFALILLAGNDGYNV